jgi:radical SAM protein with 4Fe4S-binding SPASM domain
MDLVKRITNSLKYNGIRGTLNRINKYVGVINPKGKPTSRICLRPFYYAVIDPAGSVYCCCSAWVKFRLGRLSRKKRLRDIWNSRVARAFRDAMLTTELDRVCHCDVCPYFISRRLPRHVNGKTEFNLDCRAVFDREIEQDKDVLNAISNSDRVLDYYPKQLEIGVDRSCNLCCSSCRREFITQVSPKERDLLDLCVLALQEARRDIKILSLLSSGEVFFSKFCSALLRSLDRAEYPHMKVDILTNGQLINDETWKKIGRGASFVRSISISIDAATKETYEALRRGGKWERLLDNMEFVKNLREHGKLDEFSINFVVSERNFREMPDFVLLGEKYNVDFVVFARLEPWYSMRMEYRKAAVHLDSHDMHREFAGILKDPVFKSKHVVLGV